MQYHEIKNSNSGILAAAFNGDRTLFLMFKNASYAYERENAEDLWTELVNVKPLAASLTDEEKVELQLRTPYTLGSEGSWCLKQLVGPRAAPYPNRKLTPEAEAVWEGLEDEAIEAAREEEAAYAKESLTAGSQPKGEQL